ncbi:MAG: hypothetical protein GY859_02970, partial [Desulfobacterales bacterium]|nr:hypothetical protein [Desulfobacterales bacterium]
TAASLQIMADLLETLAPTRKRPIHGVLPVRRLNYPGQTPTYEPTTVPAYLGGVDYVAPGDLEGSPEGEITHEIAALAQSVGWTPMAIYKWAMNNIKTEYYAGLMKGAGGCLRQRSGNAADQAALLVALMRSASYPSRIVTGVASFYPDVNVALDLTGLETPIQVAELFQKAGMPYELELEAGKIVNIRFEHVWMEAYIPYGSHRGARVTDSEYHWIAMDSSIKVKDYIVHQPDPILELIPLDSVRDDYLQTWRNPTPLSHLRGGIENFLAENKPEIGYTDLLRTRTLPPENFTMAPASLQFYDVAIREESIHIPADLVHKTRFIAAGPGGRILFDETIPTFKLSNQPLACVYEPATIEDQMLINAYGGISAAPPYLIRIRPVLLLGENQRVAVGQSGLQMGREFQLEIHLISPNGTEILANTMQTGALAVIALSSQQVVHPPASAEVEKSAAAMLYETALNYIDAWNETDDELASLLGLAMVRPLPTVVTAGNVVETTFIEDFPMEVAWKGVYIDVDGRYTETAGGVNLLNQANPGAAPDPGRLFMKLSALQGSALEGKTITDYFQVNAVSAADLIGRAHDDGVEILEIDSTNVDALLPTLPFDENIMEDVVQSVNQGLVVKIPDRETAFDAWTGVAYIKEREETGEAGYMLSGGLAGGMSASGLDAWDPSKKAKLQHPFSEPPAVDPDTAVSIQKLPRGDRQIGVVGQELDKNLTVKVRDRLLKPVPDVDITFTVKAGGGKFENDKIEITVPTNEKGLAGVSYRMDLKTSINPRLWLGKDMKKATRVNEAIIDASLPSGLTIKTPFLVYGAPDEPVKLEKELYCHETINVLSSAGFMKIKILDQYDNPVSNTPITFIASEPRLIHPCANPNMDEQKPLVVPASDPCLQNPTRYEKCADAGTSATVYTGDHGADVVFFTGGAPGAEYEVLAGVGELAAQFKVATKKFGACAGGEPPGLRLDMKTRYHVDRFGNIINAAKSGDAIPVTVEISYLKEEAAMGTKTKECDGRSVTCPTLVGDRRYTRSVNFVMAEAFWSRKHKGGVETPFFYEGDGLLTGEVDMEPGLNKIYVTVQATMPEPMLTTGCNGCGSVDGEYFEDGKTLIELWGVDLALEPEGDGQQDCITVPIDEYGLVRRDIEIPYTITPGEYTAASADVVIYKKDDPVAYIGGEIEGAGSVTLARGFKIHPDKKYTAALVLNRGSEYEIQSEKVPLRFSGVTTDMKPFTLRRTWFQSQFDSSAPGAIGAGYTDGYHPFKIEVASPQYVKVVLLDAWMEEKALLIDTTRLASGKHYFMLDYESVLQAGVAPHLSPGFYVRVEVEDDDHTPQRFLYPGELELGVDGKTLGQIIVHDVLIQDGSLNLTREDMVLEGRGPQPSFTRSYNNQPNAVGPTPLGNGWTHGLDMKLRVLSSEEYGPYPTPDWVRGLLGRFYKESDIPKSNEEWTAVVVNGTTFRKYGVFWLSERGRHGTLEEENGVFLYTSKDGTQYRYPYPMRPGDDPMKQAAPPPPAPILSITDRNDNTMTFHHGGEDRLLRVEDAVGRELLFEYEATPTLDDPEQRLTRVTGPDGIELLFTYNEMGLLATAARDHKIETYEYEIEPGVLNGPFNLVKTTDSNGAETTIAYHGPGDAAISTVANVKAFKSQDAVKTVIYPDGATVHFAYDAAAGNIRRVTDPRGNDTTYTLNYTGNPIEIEEPGGKTLEFTWSIDAGEDDNVMTSKVDAMGNDTVYEYDQKGNIIRETDPYGNAILTTWDLKYSVPLERTDRNGVDQRWEYDEKGNLTLHADGEGGQTRYAYFPTGELQAETDPRDFTTTYTYDQWGALATVLGPEGSLTKFTHDIRGRKIVATDPNENTTRYTYDSLDYPETIIHPVLTAYPMPVGSTNTETFKYDPEGNLLMETDRLGLSLSYDYTPRDQVEKITRGAGGQKNFVYDENGNLLEETDWKNQVIRHAYNELNQRISTTNRLGHTQYKTYDLAGNVIREQDYQGETTTHAYDKLNRLTSTWQPALPGQESGRIQYAYYNEADPEKNLKSRTDQEGNKTKYEYNGLYLKDKRTDALGGVHRWKYDPSGNPTREVDEEGRVTRREYDKQDRLTAVIKTVGGGEITARTEYDPAGNPIRLTDPRGKITETVFDEWNRVHQVIDPDRFVTTIKRDGVGNEVEKIDGNGASRSWIRDKLDRVIVAADAESAQTSYTYDHVGNVKSVKDKRGITTHNFYDALNRLIRTTRAGVRLVT